jgi:hypothetical protein
MAIGHLQLFHTGLRRDALFDFDIAVGALLGYSL